MTCKREHQRRPGDMGKMDGVQMTRKEILPIGVDIGGSAIKLVQLSHVYDQAELLACARITIPENLRTDQRQRLDCLKKDIPQALKANSFKGKKCILSLPAANTFIRAVKIPRLNPKATEAAVRHAAQMELPCPISEAVVRHIVAGEVYDNGKMLQEVIMIAMPLDVLNAYLDVFRRMGLEVVGVGVAPVALVKCFTKLLSNSILRAAFVDLGFASTQVTISHGTNIVFSRNIIHSADQTVPVFAQEQSVSSEKDQHAPEDIQQSAKQSEVGQEDVNPPKHWISTVCGEIGQCMRYYESTFRTSEVEQIIFTGGQAEDKELCQNMAQHLNRPAQIGNPLAEMQAGNPNDESGKTQSTLHPDLAVGVGLSLIGEEM